VDAGLGGHIIHFQKFIQNWQRCSLKSERVKSIFKQSVTKFKSVGKRVQTGEKCIVIIMAVWR